MSKRVISISHRMKGTLDDDYTLYDDGSVLHFYDKNTYPNGQNVEEILTVDDLSQKVRERLLEDATDENKGLAKVLLKMK